MSSRGIYLAGLALASALVVGACGSGGDANSASSPATTVRPPQGPLEALGSALEARGLTAQTESATGAKEAIAVGTSSQRLFVDVYYYPDPHQAAVVGNQIQRVFARSPGNGEGRVEVEGHLVIDLGSEQPLSGKENAVFDRVIETAKGEK